MYAALQAERRMQICGFTGGEKDAAYVVLQAERMLRDVYSLRYVYGF